MANYDDDSIIGDIADRVVKSGINRVVNSAKDTVENILNLNNSKNKNDNTKTDNETDDEEEDDTEKYEQNAVIARTIAAVINLPTICQTVEVPVVLLL